jgi:lipid II:glycine glycyltransferase (peptidoglycan interpeptide bridge formation enzyme)
VCDDVHTLKRRRLLFTVRDVWLKADTDHADADLVYYMNVDRPLGDEWEEHWTIVNDLARDENTLLSGFERSTRYQVRLAERKDDVRYEFLAGPDAEALGAFFHDYDEMAALKRIRPVERDRTLAFHRHGLLTLSRVSDASGATLAWHVYRCNRERVVLIFTVSMWFRSNDPEMRKRVGRANRYCHWQDMLRFKERGVRWYDLGGWYHKADDEEKLRINRFKEGFGGEVLKNYLCVAYPTWKGKAVKLFKGLKRRLAR